MFSLERGDQTLECTIDKMRLHVDGSPSGPCPSAIAEQASWGIHTKACVNAGASQKEWPGWLQTCHTVREQTILHADFHQPPTCVRTLIAESSFSFAGPRTLTFCTWAFSHSPSLLRPPVRWTMLWPGLALSSQRLIRWYIHAPCPLSASALGLWGRL